MIKFIYLQAGPGLRLQRQLRYSISTLLAEMPEASGNIVIYTDNASLYASDGAHVTTRDISSTLKDMTNGGKYFFRAKPCVLLDALRTFSCTCVFLDTDTFARRGFARALKRKLLRGAVMDKYLRQDPFPELGDLEILLPSGKTYRYDSKASVMYNSGVIGVHPEHAPAIADSIAIIDAIRPLTRRTHDHEQFAVNEAFRVHGIGIDVTHRVLKHYCAKSQKHYMNWRFEKNAGFIPVPIVPSRPRITVNKPIGWCFKRAVRYSLVQYSMVVSNTKPA